MLKRSKYVGAAATLVLGLGIGCSSDKDSGDGGNGGSGGSPEFRDIDNDGELDPLTPEDFDGAATPVSEDDLDAMRDRACTGWVAEPEPLGAGLFMVVDASGSMAAEPPEGGPRSKWEITRDAITEAVGSLSDDTAVGFLAYPNQPIEGEGNPSMCVNTDALVQLGLLGQNDHRAEVIDGLNAVQTSRCTPTFDAYRAGLQDVVAQPFAGQKYMLLMTDGTPTLAENCAPGDCNVDLVDSESPIIAEIAAAYTDQHIRTFILGCPGSEEHTYTGLDNRWWLSQAAEAGGTSPGNCSHDAEPYCHFDMTGEDVNFAQELRDALVAIAGQVVSCQYAMPTPPAGESLDTNSIDLVLRPDGADPFLIQRTEAPCEQGWFLNENTQQVEFCSETCDLVQSDPNAEAELMFGCAEYVPPPE